VVDGDLSSAACHAIHDSLGVRGREEMSIANSVIAGTNYNAEVIHSSQQLTLTIFVCHKRIYDFSGKDGGRNIPRCLIVFDQQ